MADALDREIARQLRMAERMAAPIAPFAHRIGPADIDRAYRIQHLNTRHAIEAGRQHCGWKIGLTAEAVQRQLGVDEPDYGALHADMALRSGDSLDLSNLIHPRIEAEIGLVVSSDITRRGLSPETVAGSIAHAVPALEIVDSRIADWKIGIVDTIADNGAAARFVLGDRTHPLGTVDLARCRMELRRNGVPVSAGVGAASLGHPLTALCWLADILIDHGMVLRTGDLVLTGALGPVAPLASGDRFTAAFDQLSDVTLHVR
ncbi:MAG: fumarylacetoacetate hydrolase family protein [Rhodospirillaceae bacterium]|nr:fumarylacetoacetate hydrolase family protein [Rhodospirillaceae bacterium]